MFPKVGSEGSSASHCYVGLGCSIRQYDWNHSHLDDQNSLPLHTCMQASNAFTYAEAVDFLMNKALYGQVQQLPKGANNAP